MDSVVISDKEVAVISVGEVGPPGAQGQIGNTGPAGIGVPSGGLAGQPLTKIDGSDHSTQWSALASFKAWLSLQFADITAALGFTPVAASHSHVTADYTNSSITYQKIQNVSADKVLGSVSGGIVEEIACTSAGRALIDDATATAQRTTLALGTTDAVRQGSLSLNVAPVGHQLHVVAAANATVGALVKGFSAFPTADILRVDGFDGFPIFAVRCTGVNGSFGTFVSGCLSIGTALNPNNTLLASHTSTDPVASIVGANFTRTLNLTANSAQAVTGAEFWATISANAFNATGRIAGGDLSAIHGGTGTVSNLVGGNFRGLNSTTGTVTSAKAGSFVITNLSTGVITNSYGVFVAIPINATGTITNSWGVYVEGAQKSFFGGAVEVAGSFQLTEMAAPAAPAANNVRLYAEDNGSGKTRLMALFPTGIAQQISIEP